MVVDPGKGSPASVPETLWLQSFSVGSRGGGGGVSPRREQLVGHAREPLAQFPGRQALPQDSCGGCARASGRGRGVLESPPFPLLSRWVLLLPPAWDKESCRAWCMGPSAQSPVTRPQGSQQHGESALQPAPLLLGCTNSKSPNANTFGGFGTCQVGLGSQASFLDAPAPEVSSAPPRSHAQTAGLVGAHDRLSEAASRWALLGQAVWQAATVGIKLPREG